MAIETRQIQMVDLQTQYQKIKKEVDAAIQEVMDTGMFVNGPAVKEFCDNLASFLDVKHVIPCANGTDALQIALMALDLKPGDEVITCPFTFVATVEVIALLGLKPVFVDVDPDTYNMDVQKLKAAITEKTKAIIPIHLFGQGADMEPIMKIADEHGIPVVEDNAQAIGADYYFKDGKSQKLGTIGKIGCTSFFPSKNLGAFGDGGAMFTNDDALADRLRMIVNHGMKVRYYHDDIGVNSRLDAMQAAVLNVKLKHLETYNEARREAANFYDSLLMDKPDVQTPVRSVFSSHVFHQYTLKIEGKRDQVAKHLQESGIPHGIYYPVPLHVQKAYDGYGYKAGDFPVSETLAEKVLSLPMHTELDESLQKFIIEKLEEGLNIA
ncbi:MAG: DegT/DnrJ/EryC1/StrS family aminotransferase [Saprospiraceae bacterium]